MLLEERQHQEYLLATYYFACLRPIEILCSCHWKRGRIRIRIGIGKRLNDGEEDVEVSK